MKSILVYSYYKFDVDLAGKQNHPAVGIGY